MWPLVSCIRAIVNFSLYLFNQSILLLHCMWMPCLALPLSVDTWKTKVRYALSCRCDSPDCLELHWQLCVCECSLVPLKYNTDTSRLTQIHLDWPCRCLAMWTCLLQKFPVGQLGCGTSSVSTSSDLPWSRAVKKRRLDGVLMMWLSYPSCFCLMLYSVEQLFAQQLFSTWE